MQFSETLIILDNTLLSLRLGSMEVKGNIRVTDRSYRWFATGPVSRATRSSQSGSGSSGSSGWLVWRMSIGWRSRRRTGNLRKVHRPALALRSMVTVPKGGRGFPTALVVPVWPEPAPECDLTSGAPFSLRHTGLTLTTEVLKTSTDCFSARSQ